MKDLDQVKRRRLFKNWALRDVNRSLLGEYESFQKQRRPTTLQAKAQRLGEARCVRDQEQCSMAHTLWNDWILTEKIGDKQLVGHNWRSGRAKSLSTRHWGPWEVWEGPDQVFLTRRAVCWARGAGRNTGFFFHITLKVQIMFVPQ